MGIVGLRLVMVLRGLSCLKLEQYPPKKGITCVRRPGADQIQADFFDGEYRTRSNKLMAALELTNERLATFNRRLRDTGSYLLTCCRHVDILPPMKRNQHPVSKIIQRRQIVGFSLPPQLAAEVKIEAARRNISLRKLFTDLWTLYRNSKPA